MYKNKKILAIIPARGGSKGIPLKNIFKVGGRPLIEYTIDCASDSKYIDRTIISTDSEKIKSVSERYINTNNKRVDIPFLRPEELATDTSKTIDCVVHAVEWLKKNEGLEYDYLVLLQNTSPLRKSFHIDEAIEMIIDKEEKSLVSLREVTEHPILVRSLDENGKVKKLLDVNSSVRRQDFKPFYKIDGSIYIVKIDEDFGLNTSFNDGELGYIMEDCYSVDVDNYLDVKAVEYYLEKEREKEIKLMK